MNHRVIGIQVLFLIWRDQAGDQCDSEIRCMIRGRMRMSAAAAVIPMQSCSSWRGQARAMMSPSLAHKLWLTLWGLEGKEMEWNENAPSLRCGMASGEKMRGEMVMVGEGGGDASSKTSAWAKGTQPQPPTAARNVLIYMTVNLRWRHPLLSITREKNREKRRRKKRKNKVFRVQMSK